MRVTLFISVLVLGGLAGCRAGQGVLRRWETPPETVYEYPLEELWPVVRPWFQEAGFQVREDAEHFVLQTAWREEFQGSSVAGYWHRYTVIGRRRGLSSSQLWLVHSSRSPDGAPIHDLRQPGWDISRVFEAGEEGLPERALRVEEMDVRLPSLEPRARFVSQDSVTNVALALESPAMASDSLRGMRDFALEARLKERLAPLLEARGRGMEAAALAATRQEPGGAFVECGPSILGLAERAQRGQVLLLGELHGTQQVPRFVALGACQVSSRGVPLSVGLELPVEEEERVQRFLSSPGTEQDQARLLEGPFWRRPYPDGRSSEAVARLLEQLRWLRAQGLDVQVFVFDHPGLQGEVREAAMARVIISQVEAHPERFHLVVSGNIHPRTQPGVPWDLAYRPMGYLLARKLPSLLALDVAFDSGTAWICSVQETLECGVRPARGQDNGERYFVSLFERPSEAGFHGVFYVGAVSASPPAVRAAGQDAASPPP